MQQKPAHLTPRACGTARTTARAAAVALQPSFLQQHGGANHAGSWNQPSGRAESITCSTFLASCRPPLTRRSPARQGGERRRAAGARGEPTRLMAVTLRRPFDGSPGCSAALENQVRMWDGISRSRAPRIASSPRDTVEKCRMPRGGPPGAGLGRGRLSVGPGRTDRDRASFLAVPRAAVQLLWDCSEMTGFQKAQAKPTRASTSPSPPMLGILKGLATSRGHSTVGARTCHESTSSAGERGSSPLAAVNRRLHGKANLLSRLTGTSGWLSRPLMSVHLLFSC